MDDAAKMLTAEFKTKYPDWQTMGPVANVVRRVYAEAYPMIRGILFDLDGVLYNRQPPDPGRSRGSHVGERAGDSPPVRDQHHLAVARRAGGETRHVRHSSHRGGDLHARCRCGAVVARPTGRETIALFLRPSTRAEFAGLPCLPDDAERGATTW